MKELIKLTKQEFKNAIKTRDAAKVKLFAEVLQILKHTKNLKH